MSEMVEKVARALAEDIEQAGPAFTRQKWDDLSDLAKVTMYRRARAAIEGMREPTDDMIRARWPSYHPWGQNAPAPEDRASMFAEMVEKTKALWSAMIDAALNPPAQKGEGK